MHTAALIFLLSATDGGTALSSLEFSQKLRAFAKGGGGDLHAVAVTLEPNRPDYAFQHWAGFFISGALQERVVTRPSPPFLLVRNHPSSRESDNQNVVEELVRWEPDGTFVSTGIIYAKWGGKGRSSEAFKAAAMKLLKRP